MRYGEQFLGVDGLVDGDEVVLEAGDCLQVLEADDDGPMGHPSGKLPGGNGTFGARCLGGCHRGDLPVREIACERVGVRYGMAS